LIEVHDNKTETARHLGLARSTLYYQSKKPAKDWQLKQTIEATLVKHPSYGSRRIAQTLGFNRKKIKRVMNKFGLKPYRRRRLKYRKIKAKLIKYPNQLRTTLLTQPHQIWASDFTYLSHQGRTIYVCTVMDIFTRQVVGVSVLTTHTSQLVIQAIWNALLHFPRPAIFHSDNGSEYQSALTINLLAKLAIEVSRSTPGCPWENGYQESFYSKFKVELGDPNRFASLGELVAEIYQTIYYYNTQRIHSALAMPPNQFLNRHLLQTGV